MPALVISLEGPDFTGKSTISSLIVEKLRRTYSENGIIIKKTEVPSIMVTGFFPKVLRGLKDKPSSRVIALAYAADHLYHYENYIKQLDEREEKYVIIQERSLLSTFVYQGILGDLDLDWLKEINKYDKNIPDLTLVLKVDYNELIRRKSIEKREYDIYEKDEFLKKEISIYYNLPEELKKEFNVVYVDANKNVDEVVRECFSIINDFIKKKYQI